MIENISRLHLCVDPQVFKGLFMKSFPRIIDGTELTVENVEDVLVRYAKVLNHHVEVFGNGDKKLGILKKLKIN